MEESKKVRGYDVFRSIEVCLSGTVAFLLLRQSPIKMISSYMIRRHLSDGIRALTPGSSHVLSWRIDVHITAQLAATSRVHVHQNLTQGYKVTLIS
jgi:hypothetical protein